MEGRALLKRNLHKKWCIPNQNSLRRNSFVGVDKGGRRSAVSFCSCFSQSVKPSREIESLDSCENQLRSLDSYFRKLHNDGMQPSLSRSNRRSDLIAGDGSDDQFTAEKELTSLEDYFERLKKDTNSKTYKSSSPEYESYVAGPPSSYVETKKLKTHMQLRDKENRVGEKISDDETSYLYLIGILAAANIAVFLFEIASPVKNYEFQLFSLPMLYGAKINQLIIVGEWWRLVTPMFLHAGVFHIGLSSWMLLNFGPQVCRVYGTFAFFLIYVLGGLSGNLFSFLHTPDPTVGGTGPVFAIVGALIAYQIQNRGLPGNNATLQKALIATCLSCTLSNFGPVDDWTHLGAVFTGLAFGFCTCPMIQVDDNKASESGQEEGIRLVTRYADSCKSFAYFCFFILLWCSLLFAVEPPL